MSRSNKTLKLPTPTPPDDEKDVYNAIRAVWGAGFYNWQAFGEHLFSDKEFLEAFKDCLTETLHGMHPKSHDLTMMMMARAVDYWKERGYDNYE